MNDQPLEDHFVVCGWNAQGSRMIDDLLSVRPPLRVAIVCRRPAEAIAALPDHPNFSFWRGDPSHPATLQKVNVASARAVVILAERGEKSRTQTVDARTILTALSIRRLSENIFILAELRRKENLDLVLDAGVDEWVMADHFSGAMLSQSVQSPGLSELFTKLFETGAGYVLSAQPVPDRLLGQYFSRALPQTIEMGLGALAGLQRDGELFLPPAEDLLLGTKDQLLLVRPISSR